MSAAPKQKCGHSTWQGCDCDKPIRDAYSETIDALNALADELKVWCQKLRHDSTCIRFEIGCCYCSVHSAMKALDEKYRKLSDAIERTYKEAVANVN